jgi:exodeoxyribonuclease VII small subunit
MAKKKHEMSYESAIRELEAMLVELEQPQTELDNLQAKLARATELLHYCRAKLRDVSAEIARLRPEEPDNK